MDKHQQKQPIVIERDYSKYGFREPDEYVYKMKKGLSKEIVEEISKIKKESKWMLAFRLKALEFFEKRPVPTWGADLSGLNFDDIVYYIKPTEKQAKSWEDLPEGIRRTFEKLGIPEAERKFLAGVESQYDSEVVYHKLKEDLEKQGVIFTDMDTGVRGYPEIVKKYFGTIVPPNDNKFAALNSAVWSGGCLTRDTQIFVNDGGLTTISEIQPGQHVYSWNPLTNSLEKDSVIARVYNGKKNVFEIFVGGRIIKTTESHRFLKLVQDEEKARQFRRSWKTEWAELKDIKEGDYICIVKKLPNEGKSLELPSLRDYKKNKSRLKVKKMPGRTNEDLMWLLGIWLGDGHTSIKNNMGNINFALPKSDEARSVAIKIIKGLFGYKVTTLQKNSFEVHSLALASWLKELGFYGNAHNKNVPNWVFSLPRKQKLAFIGGYLDADGHLENDGKIASFSSVNKELLEKIKLLGISTGLFSDGKITKRKRMVNLDGRKIISVEYRLRFSGRIYLVGTRKDFNLEKFMLLEKGTYDKYNGATGFHFEFLTNEFIGFAKVKRIKKLGVEDVYDIQTHKNHNFVANGIIVHNSFVYVPEGVEVKLPLQAYFRINSENMGQFERTLIIAEPNSKVFYVEGCTAATYQADALHAAVVEIIALPGSHVKYTTLQNWSTNVYNLVTKRARAYENATVIWHDANLGSKATMKYPSIFLAGRGSRGEILSVAFAGKGQNLDAGAKAIHMAPDTSSTIVNKSVSKDGGRTNFRGFVKIFPGAENSKSHTKCDALILDEKSNSGTIPQLEIDENRVNVGHEATVGKVGEDQLFYLMSRGLTEDEAVTMIVNGFFETFTKELPLEYAVEFNRLIQLEMTGAVG